MTRNRRLLALAAASAALVGLVAIYVKGPFPGNGDTAMCAAAVETAKRLRPLARGEVAAFQPAERPESLATLGFAGPSDESLKIADFAGRTVLVNFWATWCLPCREEMPALDRLAKNFPGVPFTLLAIDADPRDEAKSRAFLTEIGADGLPYHADRGRSVFQSLKSRGMMVGLPTTILIDKNGCSLGSMAGPAAWDSADALALVVAAIEANRQ